LAEPAAPEAHTVVEVTATNQCLEPVTLSSLSIDMIRVR
jgi:hypothetical protein